MKAPDRPAPAAESAGLVIESVRVDGLAAPRVEAALRRLAPRMAQQIKKAGASGSLLVQLTVAADGSVSAVNMLRGPKEVALVLEPLLRSTKLPISKAGVVVIQLRLK
jgi:hypothetical protein